MGRIASELAGAASLQQSRSIDATCMMLLYRFPSFFNQPSCRFEFLKAFLLDKENLATITVEPYYEELLGPLFRLVWRCFVQQLDYMQALRKQGKGAVYGAAPLPHSAKIRRGPGRQSIRG